MDHGDIKRKALREQGALHSKPKAVKDPLFRTNDFFDPQDLVLVKYEMLRRVRVDGKPVTETAKQFGFSRVALYQTMAAYRRGGLPGLLPRKRGPKHRHKLNGAVMAVVSELRKTQPTCSAATIAEHVRQRLGTVVHRRSIERALARTEKKGLQTASL